VDPWIDVRPNWFGIVRLVRRLDEFMVSEVEQELSRVMAGISRRPLAGGDLYLSQSNTQTSAVLRTVALNRPLPLFSTLADALIGY
jgi:hypothetical protein